MEPSEGGEEAEDWSGGKNGVGKGGGSPEWISQECLGLKVAMEARVPHPAFSLLR